MADVRDVLVIGAGSAGTHVARSAARAGLRVTVIDAADELGGTCLWHGCVPKKALYVAAQTRREMTEAARMGFGPAPHDIDWTRLMAWRLEAQRTYAGDQEGILRGLGVEVVHGEARFVSPEYVDVGGTTLTARHVVIATGSRPLLPHVPGIELADTSDDALRYPERPASLAIVGGGYVGMEFAGIYAAFGTDVTVVLRGEALLKAFDPEAAALARRGLEEAGVSFVTDVELEAIEQRGMDLTLLLRTGDADRRELTATRVLIAAGRRPDLDGLDLAAGGVEADKRGRPVLDRFLRSVGNPRVWVAGDAAGGAQFTPVADFEGEAVARSIVDGVPRAADLSLVPSTCFTIPEIARVGLGVTELAARGAPYQVARGDFEWVAQAIISGRRGGLIKLLAAADGRLLGAHLAGPHAGDLIYTLAVIMRAGGGLADLQATRAVHPTLAEALNWAAFSVQTVTP